MNANLWFFLSVCVIFGVGFCMFIVYLQHLKTMKQLELNATQHKKD
ncbi:hypothetical protein JAO78_006350 [Alishewanella sp. 16-MA]|uniref:DUF3149 domain-containing protein n=1 Tax=Alishewanella maricola TaxID=2795740 RepID=A0ABS8C293_9ALTE|nr:MULTISPECIES: hypothetical protein [Gammaproteobacteria]MDP4944457.1 hypothetical protein [Alishewanella sp.]MDP5206460.1 hypothetical protein [Alishewanella sp. SMS9]MCB5226432.1 hypothetical protein [Alishewanella maricola]MCC5450556.1 hypothetical protein [Rheinheimera sp. UJ51]MCF4008784.1 hypothetical protein [Rheinheimera sp. UJ63]